MKCVWSLKFGTGKLNSIYKMCIISHSNCSTVKLLNRYNDFIGDLCCLMPFIKFFWLGKICPWSCFGLLYLLCTNPSHNIVGIVCGTDMGNVFRLSCRTHSRKWNVDKLPEREYNCFSDYIDVWQFPNILFSALYVTHAYTASQLFGFSCGKAGLLRLHFVCYNFRHGSGNGV